MAEHASRNGGCLWLCEHDAADAVRGPADDVTGSARQRPSVAGSGSACGRETGRGIEKENNSNVGRSLGARKARAMYTPLLLVAGAFLLTANTLVRPALSLASGKQPPTSAEPFPPLLPLAAGSSMGSPSTRAPSEPVLSGSRAKMLSRDPAMMLHLRGGEEPKTPSRGAKRAFTDTRSSDAPTAINNNHFKRPASGTAIARAKETAQRLYKQGTDMVPSLADVKTLPHRTYTSAHKGLKKVPVALREQKRKFDEMPRDVFVNTIVLPVLGVSSLMAVGGALFFMGHGAMLMLVLQDWALRARALGYEAWQMILKSPAVGANILKTLYTSLFRAFTHPKEALATLTTAIAAAISGACASLSAHMASVRAACATLSKDAAKRARTAIKHARTLLIQLQGLLLSVHKVLTRSPRQAAVLVYSVVMALLSAQGRWRSVQLVSYLVDKMSLSPLNLPSTAELKVKFEWWKYCAVQAASGGSFHIMRPQMVYVELLMQNLYKAAGLPVAVATQALAVLHQSFGGKPSAAVEGAAVMKSLEGIARYAKMPALTSRGGVGSAVCVALVMAAMSTVTSPQLSALKDRLAKAAKPNADPKTSD